MRSSKGQRDLAKLLRARGFTTEENVHHLPGRPDIVLPTMHVVFYHGCYWHQHECLRKAEETGLDVSRRHMIRKKDQKIAAELRKLGYRVLTVWECQFKDDPTKEVDRISAIINFDLSDFAGGPQISRS